MMRSIAAAAFSVLAVCGAVAAHPLRAQAPPSTDIYVAPLYMRGGHPMIGIPVNVTDRPGYDNQPSFTPNGRSILYTSVRDDGQSDIYRFDIATKHTVRVTATPESEYSATVMPGGKRFSVIRVEADSTQRLWSFALDGSDPKLVLTAIRPVGYHAWLDKDNLALFVLGRPNALVHSNARTDKSDTLARNIGRSLLPLPDHTGFSYVRNADSISTLASMTWPGRQSRDLVALPRGSQDIAWMAKGVALTGSQSKLLFWRQGDAGWTGAADLSSFGVTGISRLAVSPDGKWIAIVASPKM